ncbi:hypothetical protein PEBR_09864 [Penicillium brasilianum]|uniref:C6 zinc finger domain protein n=1 Tax=Penicillium brasilianum TaxID=104259 RepID=A0A1S9RTU9_PENBI|nr:hypothetical protein PEBR_09864 [Penicillium brasilianum]
MHAINSQIISPVKAPSRLLTDKNRLLNIFMVTEIIQAEREKKNCVWQCNDSIHHQLNKQSPSTSDCARSDHDTEATLILERPYPAQYGANSECNEMPQQAENDTRSRALLSKSTILPNGSEFPRRTQLLLHNESLYGQSIHIDLPYSPATTRRSRPLVQFMISTFVPQLIRPTMNEYTGEVLTGRTLALAFEHPFCMHALLACCGAEIPTENPEYRALARFHYTHAVTGLRKILDNGVHECQWVVTLLCIMMLCIYERSKQKTSPGVSIHLAGAAQLIRLHAHIHSDGVASASVDQAMYRLVRESFIFHVTTSLPFRDGIITARSPPSTDDSCYFEIESALSLAEEEIRENFCADKIFHPYSPVLGFPPRLFRCIYTVWRLYQTSKFDQPSMHLCRQLEKDLCRWDSRLAASVMEYSRAELTTQKGNETPVRSTANRNGQALNRSTAIGPKLYILGSRVLLQRMVGAGLAPTDIGAEELIHQAMRVIQQLQPTTDYYADYYCWPLFAIGINLCSSSDRDLLIAQASAFWKATNNPTMRRVIDMLRVYWQSHDELVVG